MTMNYNRLLLEIAVIHDMVKKNTVGALGTSLDRSFLPPCRAPSRWPGTCRLPWEPVPSLDRPFGIPVAEPLDYNGAVGPAELSPGVPGLMA